MLSAKCEDGPRPMESIATSLRESLQLRDERLLHWAHRSLWAKPKYGSPPRPAVNHVQYYHIHNQTLQTLEELSPPMYPGKIRLLSANYTSWVEFGNVRHQLCSIRRIKFGLYFTLQCWGSSHLVGQLTGSKNWHQPWTLLTRTWNPWLQAPRVKKKLESQKRGFSKLIYMHTQIKVCYH